MEVFDEKTEAECKGKAKKKAKKRIRAEGWSMRRERIKMGRIDEKEQW